MNILFFLIYIVLGVIFPAIPALFSLLLFGDGLLGFLSLSDMSAADFLGCYATAVSGAALVVPMAIKARGGDESAKKQLRYVIPMMVAVSCGVCATVIGTDGDGCEHAVAKFLAFLCGSLSVVALLIYYCAKRESLGVEDAEKAE